MIFTCNICDKPTIEELSEVMPCGHMFHKHCVKDYICNNIHNCPTCNVPMNIVQLDPPMEEDLSHESNQGGWECIEVTELSQNGVNIGCIGFGQDVNATMYPNNCIVLSRLYEHMYNLSIN